MILRHLDNQTYQPTDNKITSKDIHIIVLHRNIKNTANSIKHKPCTYVYMYCTNGLHLNVDWSYNICTSTPVWEYIHEL